MAKRGERGDGGISLRSDGRWEGRYVVGYGEKGLPVPKNVLAKTKSHVFCTTCLEHGMDVKTLSTIIEHVSSSTTLNVYAHVTDEMRRTAAVKIDQGIG